MILGIKEYLRNFWFNFISIIILSTLMITTVVLLSTLDKETRIYRMMKPYMGEHGYLVSSPNDETIAKLNGVERVLTGKRAMVQTIDEKNGLDMYIYGSEEERYLKPIMKEGDWISDVESKKGVVNVVVSENSYGLKTGDRLQMEITLSDTFENMEIEMYICGIIEDGQRIYTGSHPMFGGMSFYDIFELFSFEQQQRVIMITTDAQIEKLSKKIFIEKHPSVIKFVDTISEAEVADNKTILNDAELALGGIGYDAFSESAYMIKYIGERTHILTRSTFYNYIPLIIMNVLLVSICIVGIVAIKVMRSKGYYGKLYLCGMKWKYAIVLSQFEMGLNCMLSCILSLVMIILLQRYKFGGKIYVELGMLQIVSGVCIYVVILLISGIVTSKIIRNHTSMDILRDAKA